MYVAAKKHGWRRTVFLSAAVLLLVQVILTTGAVAAGPPPTDTTTAEQAYRQAKKDYRQFNADKKLWGKRKNWTKLIAKFTGIHQTYPQSDRADDALFLAARLYSSLYNYSGWDADLQQAGSLYRKIVADYGQSRLADDALYHLATTEEKLGQVERSRAALRQIIQDFPQGDMVGKAKARLTAAPPVAKPAAEACPVGGTDVYRPDDPRENGKLAGKARVDNIRYWSSPTYTRVVIDLDHEVSYSKGVLKHEKERDRIKSIYLDLKNSFISGASRTIPINDGILKQVKVAQFDKQTVRTVIYLDSIEDYKIFDLSNPSRIVVDVIGDRAAERVAKGKTQMQAGSPGEQSVPTADQLSLAQQLGLGIGTIIIDPGHGGKDPGAVGPRGVKEKDLVLDISRKLQQELQKLMDCRVELTRDHDCFLPLEERTVIANTKKADLFVSVHVNASRNRKAQGVETYFLNLATDNDAMELAALENATSTKKISDLQLILNDLMRNSKINESSRLARTVQDNLVHHLRRKYQNVHDLGVKQAPFYVLIGAQMPSILVEASFVSNKIEEKRLNSDAYRQKVAEGIAAGIKSYIDESKLAAFRP